MPLLEVLTHPLGLESLTKLRMDSVCGMEFREQVQRLSLFLAMASTDQLPLQPVEVTTPMQKVSKGGEIVEPIVLVPILRAGLGMLNSFQRVLPGASVGFIGLERDERTLLPRDYYINVPSCAGAHVYLLDPMLATGGSALAALTILQTKNPRSITLVSIISAPEGIKAVQSSFPDIRIVTASIDEELNDIGYILPGLGDAGDRLWGTQ